MLQDYLKLHLTVFIFGFTAILGVLITVPTLELVFYRTLIASAGLALLMYQGKKRFGIGNKAAGMLMLNGMLVGLHWIAFFGAAKVSTASIALAGVSTCSLWTSFIEPMVTGKKIKLYEVVLGAVVIAGLYVIFSFETDNFWGLVLALSCAALAALFSVFNISFTAKHEPMAITLYELFGACITSLIAVGIGAVFFGYEPKFDMDATNIGYVSILALVCTVFPFVTTVELLKRLSAFNINLTINLEPVYGIILAVLILNEDEKMSPQFYWGTLIILMSVVVYPFLKKRFDKEADKI